MVAAVFFLQIFFFCAGCGGRSVVVAAVLSRFAKLFPAIVVTAGVTFLAAHDWL